jgi:16S rRNA (adenine1518-N6/adenine1519-N6)-dimethyltransferase
MIQRPKKRWGQNFLIDQNILRKIAKCINPNVNDTLIEIGAGTGALTEHLLKSGATVYAIEIDNSFTKELQNKFSSYSNFHLCIADALKFDFSSIFAESDLKRIRFVGNIPYNISSPLLFKIYGYSQFIYDIHFLVQKEIAQRIIAKPNNKNYGILSVITHLYGKPDIEFNVSPNVFKPIPKVTSSLVSILIQYPKLDSKLLRNFFKVVKTAFGKRRKKLKNAIAEFLPKDITGCPIDLNVRAEMLSVEEFLLLTNWLYGNR